MNDSPFFQNVMRAWNPSSWNTGSWNANAFNDTAWNAGAQPPFELPGMSAWKSVYFDCPVAVAAHFQAFLGRATQEQMQFISELSREQNPANALSKELAYLQQAAVAWNTELMELAELVQSKLAASGQLPPSVNTGTKG